MIKLSGIKNNLSVISNDFCKIVMVDKGSNVVFSNCDCYKRVSLHSVAKLIQILPVYLLRLDEKYHLTEAELTVMSSSHLGQSQHMKVLNSLLIKTGLYESDLILPPSYPAGKVAFENCIRNGYARRKLFHPCSGNHLAMMLVQRELTGSSFHYERTSSPIHQIIFDLICEYAECPANQVGLSTDYCGVPCFELSFYHVACIYKNLAGVYKGPVSTVTAAKRHIFNIKNNPTMLEGDDCISTLVSELDGLFGKTGAGGLFAMGSIEQSIGIVLKTNAENWIPIIEVVRLLLYGHSTGGFVALDRIRASCVSKDQNDTKQETRIFS